MKMIPMHIRCVVSAAIVIGYQAAPAFCDVTQRGDNAARDNVWVKESWSEGAWVIHTQATLYTVSTAKMVWPSFPGATGDYSLKLKVFAKANGPAPIWVVVDGNTVWKGETPLPPGQDFIYCCGSKNTRDCSKKKGDEGPVWIDTKKTVHLKEGSRVEFWGKTAYHCQPDSWRSGTTMTGYGGGTYAGFYELLWVGGGSSTPAPAIALNTSSLTFSATAEGADPSTKTVQVSNGGGGTLPSLTASESAGWLSLSVEGSGNTQLVVNRVTLSSLTAGDYTTRVTIAGSGVSAVSYSVNLTVTANTVAPVTVLYPNGKEAFRVGDKLTIQWKTDETKVKVVDLYATFDGGRRFLRLNDEQSIDRSDSRWSNFDWTIPQELEGVSAVGTSCLVKVVNYLDANDWDISDAFFTIAAPLAVPGRIEAENFDAGGEGVGYHDSDARNQGGAFRPDGGVDIQDCDEGGYNVGWTATGEWLAYTVNVARQGTYDIDLRVAGVEGGALRLQVDGSDVGPEVTIPATGGWQNWRTVTASAIALPAGRHVLKVVIAGGGFNLNYLDAGAAATAVVAPLSARKGPLGPGGHEAVVCDLRGRIIPAGLRSNHRGVLIFGRGAWRKTSVKR